MKFNVETTVRFKNLLAKGSHIRLNDVLDSSSGVYMVIDMTEQQLDLKNVRTSKRLVINATDDLSRYTFDVGSMQFVPSENKSFKEKISQYKPIDIDLDMDIQGQRLEDFLKEKFPYAKIIRWFELN